jgi:trehalose/maltose transport system permease protein
MAGFSGLGATRRRAAWLFLSPMLVLLALVAGWPLLRTIWFGFTDADLSALNDARFIGFGNYLQYDDGEWRGLLVNPDWWLAVRNTLLFTVITVCIETVLGLIVALVLNSHFPGRGLVRAAVLVPWAIPTIVSAKIWAWMMHDQFGFLNYVLMGIGLLSEPVAWTASPDTAMIAVVIVDVWKTTPFMALLILAALQMLPSDCYEAARLDGIGPVRVFFRVTLPLIRPAVMVAVIFRALDALRIFDLIYVLTSGSKDTMTMSVFARKELVDFQSVGYGSAAATALFVVIAVITALYLVIGKVRLGEEEPR